MNIGVILLILAAFFGVVGVICLIMGIRSAKQNVGNVQNYQQNIPQNMPQRNLRQDVNNRQNYSNPSLSNFNNQLDDWGADMGDTDEIDPFNDSSISQNFNNSQSRMSSRVPSKSQNSIRPSGYGSVNISDFDDDIFNESESPQSAIIPELDDIDEDFKDIDDNDFDSDFDNGMSYDSDDKGFKRKISDIDLDDDLEDF